MKKEHVIASKKITITVITVIDPGEDLPIFLQFRMLIWRTLIANIKDLLAPLTQQMRELRDFLNLPTKCMDRKLNFDNNLCDIICDKDLVVENEILKIKLEEADKENTLLRGEVKDFIRC